MLTSCSYDMDSFTDLAKAKAACAAKGKQCGGVREAKCGITGTFRLCYPGKLKAMDLDSPGGDSCVHTFETDADASKLPLNTMFDHTCGTYGAKFTNYDAAIAKCVGDKSCSGVSDSSCAGKQGGPSVSYYLCKADSIKKFNGPGSNDQCVHARQGKSEDGGCKCEAGWAKRMLTSCSYDMDSFTDSAKAKAACAAKG